MSPKRIQRRRVRGWKMPPNTIYVGRPTKWGNPYKIGAGSGFMIVRDAEEAVRNYVILCRGVFVDKIIKQLRGKNLYCWCKLNEKCHADVLLEIANR